MKTMKVNDSFKTALKESIRQLNNLGWSSLLSTQQNFCWAILTACCFRIKVTTEHFDWAERYYSEGLKLGAVFSAYCTEKKLTNDQCIIGTKLPDEMQSHPSEDLRKYVE